MKNQKAKAKLRNSLKESLSAVLPIPAILLILSFTIAPIPSGVMLCFFMGSLLLIAGMMFFNIGAEIAMTPMGEKAGSAMAKSRKILVVIAVAFSIGFVVTIAEPDLSVLAQQVPSIPNSLLIITVGVGVGIFLVLAMLRMLFSIRLPYLLMFLYAAVFILAFFVPDSFLAVAFDSGGVTTGPITVPFIMALGLGFSAVRSDKRAGADSFGLVSLCSIGPILAVMVLGIVYSSSGSGYSGIEIPDISNSVELGHFFFSSVPKYFKDVLLSMLPICGIFVLLVLIIIPLRKSEIKKIVTGLIYTFIGLVLFLTGANAGFMPAGCYLGEAISKSDAAWIIIPIAMVMGYFTVKAEPAVYVLKRQVEEITDGGISENVMGTALSVGVAVSLGIAMLRVITGINIMYFIIPGYLIALIISLFVPKLYTSIAFDSGGVASGPMTAAFLLPFAQGACKAVGGNPETDAFGVVAMVAMTPLITIQVLGLISEIRDKRRKDGPGVVIGHTDGLELYDDSSIIEF